MSNSSNDGNDQPIIRAYGLSTPLDLSPAVQQPTTQPTEPTTVGEMMSLPTHPDIEPQPAQPSTTPEAANSKGDENDQ